MLFRSARRQWNLRDNGFLKYQWLGDFDAALMKVIRQIDNPNIHHLTVRQSDHMVSFMHGDFLFVINFSPNKSHSDYAVPAEAGSYKLALSSDGKNFGGQERIYHNSRFFTSPADNNHNLKVYLPARTGIILQKVD